MARNELRQKKARRGAGPRSRRSARRRPRTADPLLSAMKGATRVDLGGVQIDMARAGAARVKRVIYPAGFRWSVHMKPAVGTELCMHAHVGFLARGEIRIEYADGCVARHKAPKVLAIEPGHEGRVVGKEPAVLIELDFERDTVGRLGLPPEHRHP